MTTVRVNRKGAGRIVSGHPWVFASDIVDRQDAVAGSPVQVVDPRGVSLGTAFYSSASQITLRMLSPRVETIDRGFVMGRLKAALDFRGRFAGNTDAYRLVYSEADFLPGLIVDRYGSYLVLQSLSQGAAALQPLVVDCLQELLTPKGIFARNDAQIRAREDLPMDVSILTGEVPERVIIRMNGLELEADLRGGQKTGIFLDQRENYVAAASYASGRALDCFTCTGGFALHLAARCESVEAVDSSEHALTTAGLNAKRNSIENIQFREADAFEVLASHARAHRRFRTIVLDPPAFTRNRGGLEGAARGYKDINLRALRLLEPGGILVTCSCSHHFSEAMLLETVAAAALDAGRTLRVLERRTQAVDHPILLTVPETHYLKCLILQAL